MQKNTIALPNRRVDSVSSKFMSAGLRAAICYEGNSVKTVLNLFSFQSFGQDEIQN